MSLAKKKDIVNGKVCFGQSCRGLKNMQEEKENFNVVASSLRRGYNDIIFIIIFVLS